MGAPAAAVESGKKKSLQGCRINKTADNQSTIRGVRRIQTDRKESCSSWTEAPCSKWLSIPCLDPRETNANTSGELSPTRCRPPSRFLPLPIDRLRMLRRDLRSTISSTSNFLCLFRALAHRRFEARSKTTAISSSRQTREDKKRVPIFFTGQPDFWLGNRPDPLRVFKMERGYTYREINGWESYGFRSRSVNWLLSCAVRILKASLFSQKHGSVAVHLYKILNYFYNEKW